MKTVISAYRLLDKRARFQWSASIPATIPIALLDGFALGLLFSVIQVIADADTSDADEHLGWVGDLIGSNDPNTTVAIAAAAVAGLFLLKSAFAAGFSWWSIGVMSRAEARLATRLFESYVRAPVTLHRRVNSADTIRALNSSLNSVVRSVLVPATVAIGDAAVLITTGVVLLLADPLVSVVTGAYVLIASTIFVLALSGTTRRLGRRSEVLNAASTRLVQEGLDGVKTIQAIGAEDHLTAGFARVRSEQQGLRQLSAFLQALPRYYLEATLVITAIIVASVAGTTLGGDEALAYLSLLVAAALRSLGPAGRVVGSLNTIRVGGAGIGVLEEAMDEIAAAEAATQPLTQSEPMDDHGLRLEAVRYVYEDGRCALDRVDLHIPFGQSVGIVGPSGSGKSTLAAVISGLLVPSSGSIWIDGQPMEDEALDAYRRRTAFVPQTAFLTDEALRNNVAFGLTEDEIDDQKVEKSLRDAGLAELLRLPGGIEASFGENGIRLSGGQRQRVAIARALYRDPEVLVLDEATASVDNETEERLVKLIDGLAGQRTVIRIAHRMETARSCDRVVLLCDGKVDGIGSFDELEAANAHFRSMAELERTG